MDFNTSRALARGATPAVVQSVVLAGGRPYVDTLGSGLRSPGGVPVLVLGGGRKRFIYSGPTPHSEASFEPSPSATDASQVVLVPREDSGSTYAVGALAHIKSEFTALAPEPGADEDHDGTVSVLDSAMVNEGSKVILDHRGQVVLVVHDVARVQLAQGGVLRISREGKAEERLPLAGPLIDYLQQLEAHVVALTNWAAGLVVTTPQGNGVPATPFARTPPTLNPAAVRSAAVKISADAG